MGDADDLGQAVAGFRRAEVALTAIVADADRLADARTEVEQARNELKVVAGALVGLASAHRDLVGQLGDAAVALRPAERQEDDRLLVALQEAERSRAGQVAEVADAVEELAHRLDRALAERIGTVVGELATRMPSADQLEAVAGRLEQLARADRLDALAERLDGLPSRAHLAALADRLDQLHDLPTAPQLEKVAGVVSGLARSDQVDVISDRLDALDRLDQLATRADLDALEQRLTEGISPATIDVASPPPPRAEDVAELAAQRAVEAVEDRLAQLFEQVQLGQRRVHQMVLAVGVSFLLFAALVTVVALL
jgi:hypothetical protein